MSVEWNIETLDYTVTLEANLPVFAVAERRFFGSYGKGHRAVKYQYALVLSNLSRNRINRTVEKAINRARKRYEEIVAFQDVGVTYNRLWNLGHPLNVKPVTFAGKED
jgi:hypothetical protein